MYHQLCRYLKYSSPNKQIHLKIGDKIFLPLSWLLGHEYFKYAQDIIYETKALYKIIKKI